MLVMGVQGWLCSNPPRAPTKVPLGSPVGTLRETLRTGLLKVSGLQVRKATPHFLGMCVSHLETLCGMQMYGGCIIVGCAWVACTCTLLGHADGRRTQDAT